VSAQKARKRTQERRQHVRQWYPRAPQLQLPYVPLEHRAEVRKFLVPALARMKEASVPVEGGHCWQVAQALTLAAASPRCNYVEGVWNRTEDLNTPCDCGCDCHHKPAPHAWNTIDGYPFCLVTELYNWHNGDGDWSREPLREYLFIELNKMVEDGETNGLDDLADGDYGHLTHLHDTSMPEELRWENEPGEEIAPWTTKNKATLPYYVDGKFDSELHTQWLKSDDYEKYRKAIDAFRAEWDERREQWQNDRIKFVFKPAIDRLVTKFAAPSLVSAPEPPVSDLVEASAS
jgi:hypothetical protein